jgi:hypothetical protein
MLSGSRVIGNQSILAHLCGSALRGSPSQVSAWKKMTLHGLDQRPVAGDHGPGKVLDHPPCHVVSASGEAMDCRACACLLGGSGIKRVATWRAIRASSRWSLPGLASNAAASGTSRSRARAESSAPGRPSRPRPWNPRRTGLDHRWRRPTSPRASGSGRPPSCCTSTRWSRICGPSTRGATQPQFSTASSNPASAGAASTRPRSSADLALAVDVGSPRSHACTTCWL